MSAASWSAAVRPIVVQSMTNTDTADIEATVRQVAQLWRAGSELVRITVDRDESAAAVPHIRDKLAARGINVPLIGDFHYIGHKLLTDHPACAEALAKYRINPGNVGFKAKRDTQFSTLIELAHPLRQAGAHRGQLGLARRGAADPADGRERGLARRRSRPPRCSARRSSSRRCSRPQRAEEIGLGRDRIILSTKVSRRPEPDRRLSGPRGPLRLCAASRAHRGGHGIEGHRRLLGRDGHPAAAGDRRHHPRLADPRAGRRPHAGSAGGAGTAADHGLPPVPAGGRGLPRLRAHHLARPSRCWPRKSRITSRPRCPSGRSAIPASRRCRSR